MALESIVKETQSPEARDNQPMDTLTFFFASDFGPMYTGAVTAGVQAIVAQYNHTNQTDIALEFNINKPYPDFETDIATIHFPFDLEEAVKNDTNKGPFVAAFVVDPLKDRENVVSHLSYKGRDIFLGHPDRGQIKGLIKKVEHKDEWQYHGTRIVDKEQVVPDREIATEIDQLWDGHAAFSPGAIHAALYGFNSVGKRKEKLIEDKKRLVTREIGFRAEEKPVEFNPSKIQNKKENIVFHYIGSNIEDVDFSSFKHKRVHSSEYGNPENWYEEAAYLNFAAINIFQETGVPQLIVADRKAGEYALVEFNHNIKAILPNDEMGSLLYEDMKPVAYTTADSIQELVEKVAANEKLQPIDEGLKRNGKFKPIETEEGYSVTVLTTDRNGNIRINANPYKLNETWEKVESVTVSYEGKEVSTFGVKSDYTPLENPEHMFDENEVGVILNPAKGGLHSSRRPKMELHIPHGKLYQTLEKNNIHISPGQRVDIVFNYKK